MQTDSIYSDENLDHPCFTELSAFESILEQIFSTLTGMIKYTKPARSLTSKFFP